MAGRFLLIRFIAVILFFMAGWTASAQDTLPEFTVSYKGGGRVVVSWTNPYPNLIQVAVQRSYDSIKRFGSVYSATSPELPINGYSDKVPEGVRVFYRIFYVMEGGAYFFTKSKQPEPDDGIEMVIADTRREQLDEDLQKIADAKNIRQLNPAFYDPERPLFVRVADSAFYTILTRDFRRFRDSLMSQTKDTLIQIGEDTLWVRPYNPPFVQRTSQFVYTDRDGYIVIKLDDAEKKKYEILFQEEDETPVFEIKTIREPYLIIDKTNFYKGGWYKFTLKESGRVKERNKIYLPRDFSP